MLRRPLYTLLLCASAAHLSACAAETPGAISAGGSTGSGGVTGGGTVGGATGSVKTCISGSTLIECSAALEVRDPGTEKVLKKDSVIAVEVGSVKTAKDTAFTILNTISALSAADLVLLSVRLDYTAKSPKEDTAHALECWNADATVKCEDMDGKWKKVVPGQYANEASGRAAKETFLLRFTRFDDKDREAVLRIRVANNVPALVSTNGEFKVTFKTVQGKPKIAVAPDTVDFPYVPPKSDGKEVFAVRNLGDALLSIAGFKWVSAAPTFSVTLDGAGGGTVYKPDAAVTFDPPLDIEPGKQRTFSVGFKPEDDKKKEGQIVLYSNDPAAQTGTTVSMRANTAVPCILLKPDKEVSFGGVLLQNSEVRNVQIKNCGSVDLIVDKIEFLKEGSTSNEFALDYVETKKGYPDVDIKGPSKDKPIKIGIGKDATFTVKYVPEDISKDGEFDIAMIGVTSNAFEVRKVQAKGAGVKSTCPLAKVSVKEGEEVIPQTQLHLKGDQSVAPGGGTIKKYKWTAKQPAGSNQPFIPNATFANPTFLANASGDYKFCLEVWDQNDAKSCQPACIDVLVVPNNAIHVELLWATPSDPDETDSGPAAGADMDLHFSHPLASGPDIDCDSTPDPWFNNPFDTFWFNPNPNWGSSNPATPDDPSLDLDDTDGAGPENLNLESPEGDVASPIAYPVGVHYWHDHGYGLSYATVSIYLEGTLALQITKVPMDLLDMWYVGKINWPNELKGSKLPVFTQCYQTKGAVCAGNVANDPKYCAGKAGCGQMWKPSGDFCITKCYENKAFAAQAAGAKPAQCKVKP
ncbi:MAG: hypothetical protein EXR79_02900 [Myxococcales bacterium]|nr:hypothetical protein [Myxococcales bacterium]